VGVVFRSLRLLACSLLFLPSGCRVAPSDSIGGLDVSRTLSLQPTQVVLHLPPNDGSPGLFPSSSRFVVTETRDGVGHARTEGLHWESSDPAIAIGEADGTVLAVATGSVLLSVRMSDQPSLMATASVIVKDGGRADVVLE